MVKQRKYTNRVYNLNRYFLQFFLLRLVKKSMAIGSKTFFRNGELVKSLEIRTRFYICFPCRPSLSWRGGYRPAHFFKLPSLHKIGEFYKFDLFTIPLTTWMKW